jgi:hypothetical protein
VRNGYSKAVCWAAARKRLSLVARASREAIVAQGSTGCQLRPPRAGVSLCPGLGTEQRGRPIIYSKRQLLGPRGAVASLEYIGIAMIRDYYAILGVTPTATPEEIRAAYRRLVRDHHPDLHPERPDAHAQMQALNEACAGSGDPGATRTRGAPACHIAWYALGGALTCGPLPRAGRRLLAGRGPTADLGDAGPAAGPANAARAARLVAMGVRPALRPAAPRRCPPSRSTPRRRPRLPSSRRARCA